MIYSWLQKNKNWIYIGAVYFLILLEYPTGIALSQLFFRRNLATMITPNSLLIWGLVRICLILPLIFTLVSQLGLSRDKIFMPFRNLERTTAVTFWGTITFILLGLLLYPFFLNVSTLSLLGVATNLPIFFLFAATNAYVEETFFRGILLGQFYRKMPFWAANTLQATLFMAIHLISPLNSNWFAFVFLTFILGLFWGYITRKTDSILPAIVMHIFADIFLAVSLF